MNLDGLLAEGNRLQQEVEAKFGELVAEIKRQEAVEPNVSGSGPEVRHLARELHKLLARLRRIGKRLQAVAGIDEADLEAIERAVLPRYDRRLAVYVFA